jgi:hypothetical protein
MESNASLAIKLALKGRDILTMGAAHRIMMGAAHQRMMI